MDNKTYHITETRVLEFLYSALCEALRHIRAAGETPVRAKREYLLVAEAICETASLLGIDEWHEVDRIMTGLWRNGAWLRRKGATRPNNPRYEELVAALQRELLQKDQKDDYFKHLSRTVFNCIVADIKYDDSVHPCGDCHECDNLLMERL